MCLFFLLSSFVSQSQDSIGTINFRTMDKRSSRRGEFDCENKLYELFTSANDLSEITRHQTNDISWLMAFGRYLKTVRNNPSPLLYPFIKQLFDGNLPINRGILLILKQCVYLYPETLVHLSFQQHLSNALATLTDPYLRYKYVRLLRLIIDEIDADFLPDILPSTSDLLEKRAELDVSIIIVLEKLVLIHSDVQLQSSLNQMYRPSLIHYLQSNDFDDDEIIDLCHVLFQINLHPSLQCAIDIPNLLIDLLTYIDYDAETMINWLLTPETGEKFLIFILRLIKYLSSHRDDLKSQLNDRLITTMKQFHEQLRTAHEKSLFPYNIKPLLNAFHFF